MKQERVNLTFDFRVGIGGIASIGVAVVEPGCDNNSIRTD